MTKQRIELEYILRTSANILFNCMSTPSGLEEWFAPEVNIRGEVFTFKWEGEERKANLVSKKKEQMVRFQWIEDDTMLDEYFELKIKIDDMTGELALIVTDFAEQGEEGDQKMLWDEAIEELRRHIGC
ncbi:MAG: START-like domain-containing protein [Flavobacteriales bacterium]